MAFLRLQELAAAQNSNSLTDAMSVYIERKINEDLHFADGLSHLWEVLYSRVNEHSLLIAELNVFGGPLALQCAEFFKQLSQTDSCNGLLLCDGSGMPVFDYVYNTSTNQYKKLSYPDCSLDNSPYYSSAGLRVAFDPTKSPHYKLVDVGRTFYDMNDFGSREFTIYEMTIGCSVWMVRYRVHTDDFMTPLPEGWSIRSNVWRIVLGEREQDSFLVIKLSGKVVQYNLISKTLHEIYDCGSNQVDDNHDDNDDDDDDDELLQQFQAEHNVYEFIPSFASV
ncbi:hypothetical protein Tco_0624306 [Tanacetum coccineum]|uniref:F-box protein n=1 Tax=Tanacetum coccineum TaxID=301880 RepID=A0ABQ4WDL5_9ASTR